MSEFVQTRVANRTGIITLDRPKALNSLSLGMVRDLAEVLEAWRDDAAVDATTIGTTSANSGNTFPQTYDTIGRFYNFGVNVRF